MYNPVPIRFYDDQGEMISFWHNRVDEPPSGTTNGATLTLAYTPAVAGQIIRCGQIGGPSSRGHVEVSVDGGSNWYDAAAGVALPGLAGVEQEILLRGVAVPFSGDDSEVSSFAVVVTDRVAQAAWLD